MATLNRRHNAGAQRAKGILEIASALYDSSLSTEVRRGGLGAVQVDSPLATRVLLRLGEGTADQRRIGLSFRTSGFRSTIDAVASGEISVAWVNPSVGVTMAYRGTGVFPEPQPLRVLAVFPSWDVVALAVRESTGITSIPELMERKPVLSVSTRLTVAPPFDEDTTMLAVDAILRAAGGSLSNIVEWGGSLAPVARPSDKERGDGIVDGSIDAVFDEGVSSWAGAALSHGFRFLPVDGPIAAELEGIGFRRVQLTAELVPGLQQPVPTIGFSGWPLIVREDMPDDVAYAICESIDMRRDSIPTDNGRPIDMRQLASGDDPEAPREVPLHPGAERFYRERGYLP